MRLRLILLFLCLMTVFSASAGGYLYYSSLKYETLKEVEGKAHTRAEMLAKTISFYLTEHLRPVRTIAGLEDIWLALNNPAPDALEKTNLLLDLFVKTLNADVCYVIDRQGNTIASSNRNEADSFVGSNFDFRPYFQKAIRGIPATYLALGRTSGKRGVYYSHPVYGQNDDLPVGAVVIKSSIDTIEKELNLSEDEIILVSDSHGIIFISSRHDWLYHTLRELSSEEMSQVAESRQFGIGPWTWTGLSLSGNHYAQDLSGNRYLLHREEIRYYPGWQIIYLLNQSAVSKRLSISFIRIAGIAIPILCVLIGLIVFVFYHKASREILRRKAVENDLREQKERYRYVYHHSPAMLHSVDRDGYLLDVSDYWLKALGYERHEVIGKKLSDFMTADSGQYLNEIMIPKFFDTGFVSDIPYQFVRKNGDIIDALVSAIGETDQDGNILRSLAVSIDVTERIRAEQALKQAKDELSRYSEELEKLVRIRTEEITSILKYTPDVVYIKDIQGRYLLVNPKFEELFGVRNEHIRGKTAFDCISEELANQFQLSDEKVLEEKNPLHEEIQLTQKDGIHTYLSVKFPIYDDSGNISGIGGISTDITALKKVEDQLRRLSGSIIASQEKERESVARELHDELGQMLTALRMETSWLLRRLKDKDAAAAERAGFVCDMIDKTIGDVRGIAIRLRPGVLDTLGLVDALEWYASEFEKRNRIACIFSHNTISSLASSIATTAYRITQESLTNITRHASASLVSIDLYEENGILELTISDNGQGFDPSSAAESGRLGIAGMRERAMLVGGRLEVDSSVGRGTRVFFTVKP